MFKVLLTTSVYGFVCMMSCFFFVEAQRVPVLPVTEIPLQQQPDEDTNPIRQGIDAVVGNLEGELIVEEDADFQSSFESLFSRANTIVNLVLGFLGLISLLYLLFSGFQMLFAANQDDKFAEGLKGIKTAAVALIGIGLSWVIIRFIFYIISIIG